MPIMPYLWQKQAGGVYFHRRVIDERLRPLLQIGRSGFLTYSLGTAESAVADTRNAYAIVYSNQLIGRAEAGENVPKAKIEEWFKHLRLRGTPPRNHLRRTLTEAKIGAVTNLWLASAVLYEVFDKSRIDHGFDDEIRESALFYFDSEEWEASDEVKEQFVGSCFDAWQAHSNQDPGAKSAQLALLTDLLDEHSSDDGWLEQDLAQADVLVEQLRARIWAIKSRTDPTAARLLPGPKNPINQTNPTVAQLIDPWALDEKRTAKYLETDVRPTVEQFDNHLKEGGITAIGVLDITRIHAQDFAQWLRRRPIYPEVRRHKLPLGLVKQIKAADAIQSKGTKVERIGIATYNKQITVLSSIFTFAERRGIIDANPFRMLQAKGGPKIVRDSFTASDLQAFFSSQQYRTEASPACRWIPLICLTMGLRRGEAAQLLVSDIRENQGIIYAAVTLATEAGEVKSIKTASSKRDIPIPEVLVRLGFLNYVDSVKASGKTRLFVRRHSSSTDRVGDEIGKWFGRVCNSVGIFAPSKVLHSLRHTFCDALDNAGIDARIQIALTGHADGNTRANYGSGVSLGKKADAIQALNFGFDLVACLR